MLLLCRCGLRHGPRLDRGIAEVLLITGRVRAPAASIPDRTPVGPVLHAVEGGRSPPNSSRIIRGGVTAAGSRIGWCSTKCSPPWPLAMNGQVIDSPPGPRYGGARIPPNALSSAMFQVPIVILCQVLPVCPVLSVGLAAVIEMVEHVIDRGG